MRMRVGRNIISHNQEFERAYWNQLGINIPRSKPKWYIKYDGEEIEVPKNIINSDEKIKEVYTLIKNIKSETEFLFDNQRLPYHFQSVESHYGSLFIKFHLITDVETFRKISDAVLFDGMFANHDVRMRCYQVGMRVLNYENQELKVNMLGEIQL